MVANGGHRWNIFRRAAWWLRELNALEVLTSKIPLVPSSAKISLITWTAASQPTCCPAHNWRQLAASITSCCLTTCRTALAKILLEVSPTPIGWTPGFLSRAISQQFRRRCKASGLVNNMEICLATEVKERQWSEEAVWKEVHEHLHPIASTPEGPSDPSMRTTVRWIRSLFNDQRWKDDISVKWWYLGWWSSSEYAS